MNKFFGILFQVLFLSPFVLFILFSSLDHLTSLRKLVFLALITILLFFGIAQPKFYKIRPEKDDSLTIIIVMIGAILTYSLQNYVNLNPILSAGLIGTLATIIDKRIQLKLSISLPIYCGAFVGMTNPNIHFPFWIIGLNGLIAGILFYYSKSFYGGIGGKLGTIAFASVLAGLFIFKWFTNDFYF